MDRGASWASVHWVIKSWTRLNTERRASPKLQVPRCGTATWAAKAASATTSSGLTHSGLTGRTTSPPVTELRPQEVTVLCPLAYEIQAEEGGRWRLTALIPCRICHLSVCFFGEGNSPSPTGQVSLGLIHSLCIMTPWSRHHSLPERNKQTQTILFHCLKCKPVHLKLKQICILNCQDKQVGSLPDLQKFFLEV